MACALPGSGRENNNRCIRGKEFNFPTSNYDIFQRITTHHPATAPASWPGPDHNKSCCPTLRDKQGGRHRRGTSCVRVSSWPRHCAAALFTSAQAAPAAQGKNPLSLAYNIKPWTGDLDGMKKRQQVRVLVPYNKTLYFLDKGRHAARPHRRHDDGVREAPERRRQGALRADPCGLPAHAPRPADPDLLAGKGDLVAANLTITDERRAQVDFSHPLASGVRELIVTSAGAPPLASLDDLAGREVLVNPTSSYYSSLKTLSAALQARGKRPIVIRDAPGVFETDDILEMVNADLVKITVADRYLANFWKQIFPGIVVREDLTVDAGNDIAFAFRKDSPQLAAALNPFMDAHRGDTTFGKQQFKKYLMSTKWVKHAADPEDLERFHRLTTHFQRYGQEYNIDWLLMVAQGYQESRLNQNAKSAVGAIGVMQIMPATGKELQVGSIHVEQNNIRGGIKYVRQTIDRYYANEPMTELNKGPVRLRRL